MLLSRKLRKKSHSRGLGFRVQGLGFRKKKIPATYLLTPKPYTLNPKFGFTLIELMVAASIMGVIGLTILTTFGSGFHVYERVQTYAGPQADVFLAFEEMEKELNNTFPFSTIPFEGDADSIAFPAVIETLELIDGEQTIVPSIGRVSYYLDDAVYLNDKDQGLIRTQQNYSQAINGTQSELDQGNYRAYIEGLSFEYYYFSEESGEYGWQESWSDEEDSLLSGVKIAMTYKDGGRDVDVERVILIPALQKIIEIDEEEEGEGEGEGEEGV